MVIIMVMLVDVAQIKNVLETSEPNFIIGGKSYMAADKQQLQITKEKADKITKLWYDVNGTFPKKKEIAEESTNLLLRKLELAAHKKAS